MFGDLFEENFSFVSNNQCGKGKKSKSKDTEPPAPREFTKLSGIKNQGGTCYLNSLLQTLHFTPEFREALFSLGPEELGSLEDINKPDVKVLKSTLIILCCSNNSITVTTIICSTFALRSAGCIYNRPH
ncbi:ubiquitin carboxyl-terminal hydrolase 40-like [Chelonoidis abingdonii]|uniref:ubiquitin carboxyl-terminal hydrolase 40-like n=1 Tax=Chelonoidis abingdonii TaxID=106734 RepID=UPI003F4979EC